MNVSFSLMLSTELSYMYKFKPNELLWNSRQIGLTKLQLSRPAVNRKISETNQTLGELLSFLIFIKSVFNPVK